MDTEKAHKLLHDLKGPIVNAAGFHIEIEEALGSFTELLNSQKGVIAEDTFESMTELLEEDIVPCLEFAKQALAQLKDRLAEARLGDED